MGGSSPGASGGRGGTGGGCGQVPLCFGNCSNDPVPGICRDDGRAGCPAQTQPNLWCITTGTGGAIGSGGAGGDIGLGGSPGTGGATGSGGSPGTGGSSPGSGGTSATGGAAGGASGAAGGGGHGGGGVPAQHRPTPTACADAGVPAGQEDGGIKCNSDQDCSNGAVCACASTRGNNAAAGNVCVPSNCRIDSDCGVGGYCSPTVSATCGPFFGVEGYYCHTPQDQCRNDSDCASNAYCAYSLQAAKWVCSTALCNQ